MGRSAPGCRRSPLGLVAPLRQSQRPGRAPGAHGTRDRRPRSGCLPCRPLLVAHLRRTTDSLLVSPDGTDLIGRRTGRRRPSVMPATWIDVHAHFLPDDYRSAAEAAGHGAPDGMDALPPWTAAGHLALMDRLEIGTSLLSISSPGVYFGDAVAARALATVVNDEGNRCVRAHPGRFGHLASLPLPDIEGSLEEVTRCCDELCSDGFALLTHVDGVYLGDPVLDPVFAELDRRVRACSSTPRRPSAGIERRSVVRVRCSSSSSTPHGPSSTWC